MGADWKGVATKAREGAGRVGRGDEAAMENGSRTVHGDPQPARTPSREQ